MEVRFPFYEVTLQAELAKVEYLIIYYIESPAWGKQITLII